MTFEDNKYFFIFFTKPEFQLELLVGFFFVKEQDQTLYPKISREIHDQFSCYDK